VDEEAVGLSTSIMAVREGKGREEEYDVVMN
jgi:hypothetical protein